MTDKFCQECGAKITSDTGFCSECGAPNNIETISKNISDKNKNKNNNVTLIFIAAIVLLILALSVSAIFLIFSIALFIYGFYLKYS